MMSGFEQTTIASLSIVRGIVNSLGGGLNKQFGQNFLINQNSLLKFVKSIHLQEGDLVIEIGPGIGVVTYTLCASARKVYMVEIDRSKAPALEKVLENYSNYEIIWEDATLINFTELGERIQSEFPDIKPSQLKVIGSLPYNVSKKIIYNLLTSGFKWSEAAFFLQREVSDNYTSTPPTADFLSMHAAIFADTQFAFGIPAEHFLPAPKVKTGVIHLTRHERYSDIDRVAFSKFIKHGFSQPRKTVANNLKSLGINRESITASGIKETARPGELGIDDWKKLFDLYQETR